MSWVGATGRNAASAVFCRRVATSDGMDDMRAGGGRGGVAVKDDGAESAR